MEIRIVILNIIFHLGRYFTCFALFSRSFAFLDVHVFKVSINQWTEFSCSCHRPNNGREALELRKSVCVASVTHLVKI